MHNHTHMHMHMHWVSSTPTFFSGCMVSVFEIKIEMDFGYEVNSMATQPIKFQLSSYQDVQIRRYDRPYAQRCTDG